MRAELLIEWVRDKSVFVTTTRWVVRDARGDLVQLIDQCQPARLADDEFLERSLTRRARAAAAEARAYAEERSDGVVRLF